MSSSLEILNRIENMDEDTFRRVIYGYFIFTGKLTYLTHGALENGADIVLIMEKADDVLNKGSYFYFQIKVGVIKTDIWRKSLHSQMMELFERPLNLANPINDDNVSKRVILMTNSSINQDVILKIQNFNKKHYLPIECITGVEFSQILERDGITIDKIEQFAVLRYPGEKENRKKLRRNKPKHSE